MNRDSKFLPIWVWLIVVTQVVLVLFFSLGTAFNPSNFLPGVTELDYVSQLYITRNITVALALIFTLLIQSHKALVAILLVRLLTDICDAISVYAFNVEVIKSSVPMVFFLLILPCFAAIIYLTRRISNGT